MIKRKAGAQWWICVTLEDETATELIVSECSEAAARVVQAALRGLGRVQAGR